MYTIGQVSEMFDLPISTLRYYDKEGFFPHLVRKGNIRYFSNHEIEALHLIECLKKSGLALKKSINFLVGFLKEVQVLKREKSCLKLEKRLQKLKSKVFKKHYLYQNLNVGTTQKLWRMVQKNTFKLCFQTSFQVTFKNYMMQVINKKMEQIYSAPKLFKTSWLVLILID